MPVLGLHMHSPTRTRTRVCFPPCCSVGRQAGSSFLSFFSCTQKFQQLSAPHLLDTHTHTRRHEKTESCTHCTPPTFIEGEERKEETTKRANRDNGGGMHRRCCAFVYDSFAYTAAHRYALLQHRVSTVRLFYTCWFYVLESDHPCGAYGGGWTVGLGGH